jgi:hypothetical protein
MMEAPVVAGALATAVFASSSLPMLVKARRTRDLASYSVGNIVLANVGNGLYAVYVLHLPPGPAWALHLFHTVSTALMLFWYVRYVVLAGRRRPPGAPGRPAAPAEGGRAGEVPLVIGRTAGRGAAAPR